MQGKSDFSQFCMKKLLKNKNNFRQFQMKSKKIILYFPQELTGVLVSTCIKEYFYVPQESYGHGTALNLSNLPIL